MRFAHYNYKKDKWFAWRPVNAWEHGKYDCWVWLEWVERERTLNYTYYRLLG